MSTRDSAYSRSAISRVDRGRPGARLLTLKHTETTLQNEAVYGNMGMSERQLVRRETRQAPTQS
jgi:hypothetical protein